jgi:HTH-type transcriptional regulator/antitoxin HigA
MKVIRDEEAYTLTLARVDELVALDPDPESTEGEELQVLSILIEDYERRQYPIAAPTPLEAIEFRMEQMGLAQRDVMPFIGSKSKTSEVLSGKRPLSLPMVRALSAGLGIPAEILIQDASDDSKSLVDWTRFPTKELASRSWFAGESAQEVAASIVRVLDDFGGEGLSLAARSSTHVRSGREMDRYSLLAWAAWAVSRAEADPPTGSFDPSTIDEAFLLSIARLSASDSGPLDAQAALSKNGIALLVVEHLPKTYLDGALIVGKFPVIALTLRNDRIDSFWFTLMHELSHLLQYVASDGPRSYFDDLDVESSEDFEQAADALAGETLIPEAEWIASPASKLRSPEAAQHLATRLGIHPAIVAGRIRHSSGDYRKLSRMVGQGQVRRLFSGQ